MHPIAEIILFILACAICFYLPGAFLTAKFKLKGTFFEDIFISLTLGILTFTLIAYTLSWIKLTPLLFPIFIAVAILAIKNKNYLGIRCLCAHYLLGAP